ncbi:MAG: extracellular solute-binding protein, partial [Anaerolineae bacterium]|nr:extracellular solute-binding protein [Anaerolineae bacterium]
MRLHKLFAVVLMLVLLAALGGVSAQDTTNLVIWHALQDAEGDGALALVEAFQAANPDITIEPVFNPSNNLTNNFETAAGAGEGPDAILWANDAAGNWARSGLLLPITDLVDDELSAQVTDSGWGTFTFQDEIYGVPMNAKTLAFFYN